MPGTPFFGLTTLGAAEPVKEQTKASQGYEFHNIPEDSFLDLFQRHVIGDSDVALTLEVDGSTHILRAELGDMLKELLGRQPRKFELEAWFTHLDFDRGALMGVEEYIKAVNRLREFSGAPARPVTYTSYDALRTNWLRHARIPYEAQQTYKAPLTTQQDIGWHAAKPTPPGQDQRKTLGHTDVTLKEGRTAVHYYGHFLG